MYHHAISNRSGTSRQRLGGFFDFYQAHTTISGNAELFVITKMRYVQTEFVGSMHHHAALGHFDLFAVDGKFNHEFVLTYRYFGTKQSLCSMWYANSSRKCLIKLRTGMAAASPRTKIVRPIILDATLSSRSRSSGRPCPCSMRSITR